MEAFPANNYKFEYWTDNFSVVDTSSTISFIAQNNRTLVANFSLSTDVSEIKKGDIKVYPNPANNEMMVSVNNGYELKKLTIYNILGQKIADIRINNSFLYVLDVKDLKSGIYFMQIITNKGVEGVKFQIAK